MTWPRHKSGIYTILLSLNAIENGCINKKFGSGGKSSGRKFEIHL